VAPGYGLEELVVVVEQLGRALAAALHATVITSAVLAAAAEKEVPGAAPAEIRRRQHDRCWSRCAGPVEMHDAQRPPATPGSCSSAGWPTCCCRGRDDVLVIEKEAGGVTVIDARNLDPTRRAARVTLDGAPGDRAARARTLLRTSARLISPPRPSGVARECTDLAAQ